MNIRIRKLNDDAIVPVRGTGQSAGFDLYSTSDEILPKGGNCWVKTGLAIEIPEGYFGAVFARSGLASKKGLRPANCVGVIDSDYRGEIMVVLHNDSLNTQLIKKGERVAQLVIMPYLLCDLEVTDQLSDTERQQGGFGSTGTK